MIGKKIGEGRTAEVYEWSEDRVIKLFHDFVGSEEAEREHQMQRLLCQYLPFCALIYGREIVEGRNGLIYEKVRGIALTELLKSSPEKSVPLGTLLGRTHRKIHEVHLPGLPSLKEGTIHALFHIERLSKEWKENLLLLLKELPEGDTLCHMDFHPDNVYVEDERITVLDWMTAAGGDPLADVARTEMILKFAVFPGVDGEIKEKLELMRKDLLTGYHAAYFSGGMSSEEERNLYLWETVLLGTRLREGITEEECDLLLQELSHRLEAVETES